MTFKPSEPMSSKTADPAQGLRSDVVWHKGHVQLADRSRLLRQQPMTVWLTGLSGSGKSTLGFGLERCLVDLGHACFVLDGDNIRHQLNRDLGFSPGDRSENIRRIAEVARLMNDAGLIVVTAFISPYLSDRHLAQEIIGADRFFEVHVAAPITVCEQRDPKGMYKRARSGEIKEFTGVSAPYEAPVSPALVIDTSSAPPQTCISSILSELRAHINHAL